MKNLFRKEGKHIKKILVHSSKRLKGFQKLKLLIHHSVQIYIYKYNNARNTLSTAKCVVQKLNASYRGGQSSQKKVVT